MAKGKRKSKTPVKKKTPAGSDAETITGAEMVDIFKYGMSFENTIEFIESKILDAFFGHICRQGEWDLAKQYILNMQEWCQMLQTSAKIDYNFLPDDLQKKIVTTIESLETGIDNMLKTIDKKDFDEANKVLEHILKDIRALYKIRE